MKTHNGLLLIVVLFCSLLLCNCANSEQVFSYWQNGINDPADIVDGLEREVERKHYFYDSDLRNDYFVIYSENPDHYSDWY